MTTDERIRRERKKAKAAAPREAILPRSDCAAIAAPRTQAMRLTKWLPKPLQKFVRERMTVYVYTYGFRPSPSVVDQALRFRVGDRYLKLTADHRTALYDMISEVVAYDCYQLGRVRWSDHGERRIVDIGANVGVTALVLSQIPGAQVTCYEPDP